MVYNKPRYKDSNVVNLSINFVPRSGNQCPETFVYPWLACQICEFYENELTMRSKFKMFYLFSCISLKQHIF